MITISGNFYSIAPSTNHVYTTAWRRFDNFCFLYNIQCVLNAFACALVRDELSPLTINTYRAALFGTFRFLCAYLVACMQPQMCMYYSTYVSGFITQFCTLDSAYLVKATCRIYIYLRCIAVTDSKSFDQIIRKVIQLSVLLPENQN